MGTQNGHCLLGKKPKQNTATTENKNTSPSFLLKDPWVKTVIVQVGIARETWGEDWEKVKFIPSELS